VDYKIKAKLYVVIFQSLFQQGRRSHGGSGGNCPRCPNIAGAARGQQVALFARTAPRNLCIIHRNWNLELFLSNVYEDAVQSTKALFTFRKYRTDFIRKLYLYFYDSRV
jgi:hypothetical protein